MEDAGCASECWLALAVLCPSAPPRRLCHRPLALCQDWGMTTSHRLRSVRCSAGLRRQRLRLCQWICRPAHGGVCRHGSCPGRGGSGTSLSTLHTQAHAYVIKLQLGQPIALGCIADMQPVPLMQPPPPKKISLSLCKNQPRSLQNSAHFLLMNMCHSQLPTPRKLGPQSIFFPGQPARRRPARRLSATCRHAGC
jgi:hypothetical protein